MHQCAVNQPLYFVDSWCNLNYSTCTTRVISLFQSAITQWKYKGYTHIKNKELKTVPHKNSAWVNYFLSLTKVVGFCHYCFRFNPLVFRSCHLWTHCVLVFNGYCTTCTSEETALSWIKVRKLLSLIYFSMCPQALPVDDKGVHHML